MIIMTQSKSVKLQTFPAIIGPVILPLTNLIIIMEQSRAEHERTSGVMGVPITFLDKYNPEQFEILGIANSARYIGNYKCYTIINGNKIYNRLLIRRKM